MKDVLTAVARVMALENGASFVAMPGCAYNLADAPLAAVARALVKQFDGTGIDLIALDREGSRLTAHIDETYADEPLCPAAFDRVVRRLSYTLLGEVWEGRFTFTLSPAPAAAELVRVA